MKPIACAIMLMGAFLLYGIKLRAQHPPGKIPLIIFDTDMGPDYDDVGAITVLHALAARGECKILATVASDGHSSIAPTIEAFNQYFKQPGIPVGAAVAGAPDFTSDNHWNDSLVTRFLKKPRSNPYPPALDVYREVLSRQADNSVTIITVGFTSNIRALLQSKPDRFSVLSGMELVKRKVKNWVAMAGGFPQGREFNVEKDAAASFEVFSKWPKPILFSGFEIGQSIATGSRVAKGDAVKNPVAWAYRYNLGSYDKNPQANRPSWDQTAVLCAVRQPEKYFYVNGPGKFKVDETGYNTWSPQPGGLHYFLSHKYPYETIAAVIEDLMLHIP